MKALPWLFLLLLGFALPASARPGPLLVILLPGTSLRDWQAANAPHLHQLMATGALAVMNTRTARMPGEQTRETPESALLTLGAGARAAGSTGASQFSQPHAPAPGLGVNAGQLYERRMGLPPANALVNSNWPQTLRDNRARDYDIRLGNLTDTLMAAGVTAQAGGGHCADLLAVSGSGTVLPAATFRIQPSECLIWDAGSNLSDVDSLLASASAMVTAQHGRLLIFSPFPSDQDFEHGRRLSPVLEWGEGVSAGLLNSPSTRRPGLVTNTDFAPTVAAYFGPKEMAPRPFGQAWAVQPATDALKHTSVLEEQAYRQADGMQILPYLAVGLALWILSGTLMTLKGKMPSVWPLVPPALLLALLFSATALMTGAMFLFFLLFSIAPRQRLSEGGPLLALLFLTAALIPLDALTGSHLMQGGLLGYSAIEGARYYGIGNEAMGVLVGSLLVLTGGLWQRGQSWRVTLSVLLGGTALLLGSSGAGAKAGGLLVSMLAFGTLLFCLWGGKWSLKVIVSLLLLAGGVMALAAIADAFLPAGGHSHMGEAVQRIRMGGFGEARDIIARKAAVEGRLAFRSTWACLLWIGLLCVLTLWKRSAKAMTVETAALRTAGLAAVFACLALNDAGVVAAALCLLPLWADAAMRLGSGKPLTV